MVAPQRALPLVSLQHPDERRTGHKNDCQDHFARHKHGTLS
jgi:hypothetical protein